MALQHLLQHDQLGRHPLGIAEPDGHIGNRFRLQLRQHFDLAASNLDALVATVHGPGKSDDLFRHDQIGAVPVEIRKVLASRTFFM